MLRDSPAERRKFHLWLEATMTQYEITASDLVHVTGRIHRARFKINGPRRQRTAPARGRSAVDVPACMPVE